MSGTTTSRSAERRRRSGYNRQTPATPGEVSRAFASCVRAAVALPHGLHAGTYSSERKVPVTLAWFEPSASIT